MANKREILEKVDELLSQAWLLCYHELNEEGDFESNAYKLRQSINKAECWVTKAQDDLKEIIECPECEGSGSIDDEFDSAFNTTETVRVECYKCNGAGEIKVFTK